MKNNFARKINAELDKKHLENRPAMQILNGLPENYMYVKDGGLWIH